MLFITKDIKEAIDEEDSRREYDIDEDLQFSKMENEQYAYDSDMNSDIDSIDINP